MRYAVAVLSMLYALLATGAGYASQASDAAKAGPRVAFVVGNGAYANVAKLPNPVISAKAMAETLRNVGFDVIEATDLTHEAMAERLHEFSTKAKGADIALFYYAGHGVAIDGSEYLVPIDATAKSEIDVKLGAIDVESALEQAMGEAKVRLLFVDASRDNPFVPARKSPRDPSVKTGLAQFKSAENTLTVYATGPGQVALDGKAGEVSPFTRALVQNIATPGVEIQQALTRVRAQVGRETGGQQMVWGHTNLTGTVVLNPAK